MGPAPVSVDLPAVPAPASSSSDSSSSNAPAAFDLPVVPMTLDQITNELAAKDAADVDAAQRFKNNQRLGTMSRDYRGNCSKKGCPSTRSVTTLVQVDGDLVQQLVCEECQSPWVQLRRRLIERLQREEQRFAQ